VIATTDKNFRQKENCLVGTSKTNRLIRASAAAAAAAQAQQKRTSECGLSIQRLRIAEPKLTKQNYFKELRRHLPRKQAPVQTNEADCVQWTENTLFARGAVTRIARRSSSRQN